MTASANPAAPEFRPLILLAEDDDDLRQLLARQLQRDGYRVAAARSGPELLQEVQAVACGAEPPALVIADDRMPGLRGLDVLLNARNMGWTLPLVLITAFGGDGVDAAARRGRVTLMHKPFDVDDFRTLVWWLAPTRSRRAAP